MTDGYAFLGKRLWTVTDGAEKVLQEEAARRQKFHLIKAGLVKCPVCGQEADIVIFGIRGKGVWIGCDRTEACSRYIEYHAEGWSVEDTAKDWNRRNCGLRKKIRQMKKWFYDRFGKQKREERRFLKELDLKKEQELSKRRKAFGISEQPKAKRWWKLGREGNK